MRADRSAHATQEYFIEGPDWCAESDQWTWRNPYEHAHPQAAKGRDEGNQQDGDRAQEAHVRRDIQGDRAARRTLLRGSNPIEHLGNQLDGARQLIAQRRQRLIRVETNGRRERAHVRTRVDAGGELIESASIEGLDYARAQPCGAGDVVKGQPKLHARAMKRVHRHLTHLIVGARAAH